jgi:hypothetical protein
MYIVRKLWLRVWKALRRHAVISRLFYPRNLKLPKRFITMRLFLSKNFFSCMNSEKVQSVLKRISRTPSRTKCAPRLKSFGIFFLSRILFIWKVKSKSKIKTTKLYNCLMHGRWFSDKCEQFCLWSKHCASIQQDSVY